MSPRPLPDHVPTEPGSLRGLRALVTGSTRGIGAGIAAGLAAAGVDLVLSARTASEVQDQAEALATEHGVRATAVPADLASTASTLELAATALGAYDGLDVLVNNAGLSFPQMAVDLDPELWDTAMAVNLRAPALLGSRIGAAMARAGWGRIVNVSSAAGLRALPEHYGYCASKAGLSMAAKVLALELGGDGVRVNTVCPTVVMTEMGQRVWGEAEKAAPMLARIPTGHFAEVEDVVGAVLHLCSPAAEMLNGVDLPIDGGFTVS